MSDQNNESFKDLYNLQVDFQKLLTNKGLNVIPEGTKLPVDNVAMFSQHLQHLISEIGEVLSADKRWKNFRNDKLDIENKKEELADCFIVLINMCIYSGLEAEQVIEAISNKMVENLERVKNL